MRYLALGDSYTIGEGVAEHERWPDQLARLLEPALAAAVEVTTIARTGWTTDELAGALEAAPLAPPYDLVSLLIGVNDQYRGRGVTAFARGLPPLFERAITYAGGATGRVFVLSIPHWEWTPFARDRDVPAIGREIDAFNAMVRLLAAARGIAFLDTTDASRDVANDPALTAADGLHPSGPLYARWAALARPSVLGLLDPRQR